MDDFFNHDVAEWISKSVSRMDDDEAEMFTRFFVYEVHKQDIENNRRTIDRHVEEVQKSILADLTPELRELVSKAWEGPETPWEDLYGKPQPRAKGTGRWVKIGFEAGGKDTPVKYRTKRGKEIDVTTSLNRAGQTGTTFADRWTASGPNDHSTNERTYRRVQAGAQLLEHVPDKRVKAAAQVGQFAGQFGPEAEKVVGPAARRTAYRYRGTERMPDKQLITYREQALTTTAKRTFRDSDFNSTRPPQLSPEQKMSASEDAAVGYLYKRLPSKRLSTLHRESGKLPPSEGVIINRDGDIVTQAVGYNEDHYLPFNLKNLKGLQGGSYVRTRSTGGLTSEDIYTGLVAGARSITVVSRSGVFTIDFEDDLRGGRRYSDKARQMIGRYAQTLDAVQSEKVSRRGLDPDERADIREEVEAEMEGVGYKSQEIEAEIKRREEEYKAYPKLSKAELENIKLKAMEAVQSGKGPRSEGSERYVPKDPKKAFNYYRSEFMDAAMEEKQNRMYRLDAEGYEAAMQALEEQFPYYIARAEVKKLPRGGTEKDSGYVRPNYNRPKAVRAGYFDEEINGKGKFSASELHYQNYGRRPAESAAVGDEGKKEAGAAAKPSKVNLAEVRSQRMVQERRNASVAAAAEAVGAFELDKVKQPMLTRYRETPDIQLFKPSDIDAMISELNSVKGMVLSSDIRSKYPAESAAFEAAMRGVERTDAQVKSRVPFSEDNWNPDVVSHVPQRWSDDDEHSSGHEPLVYQRAWAKTINDARLGRDITGVEMTDEQLRAKQKQYSDIYSAAKNLAANPDDAKGMERLATAMDGAGMTEQQIIGLEEAFDRGGATGLAPVVEENKKKALGVVKLRSILVASEGKLSAAPDAPESSALKGEIVRSTTSNSSLASQLNKRVDQSSYTPEVRVKVKDLAIALDSNDDQSIEDALEALPRHLQDELRPQVHRELLDRD